MGLLSWVRTTLTFQRSWRLPFDRAIAASQQGDWDAAIAEYGEVIRVNPHSTEAFFNRAVNYSRKQDWTNTILDLTETVRLNPRHLRAWHWRGVAYRSEGRYAEALADFNKALELKPQYPRAWYDRGITYHRMEDWPSAMADFSKAIEFQFNAFTERALVRTRLSDSVGAADDLAEAVRRDPSGRNHYYTGFVLHQMEDWEGAIANLDVALQKEPQMVEYLALRAFCHHAHGDYAKAIADDQEVLRLDEGHARAHNGLAWILATCPDDALRNGSEAVKHALKGYELGCGESLAYVGTLAAAYAEAGNFPEAVRWAKMFLDSDPPKENIAPARGRLKLFEQGQPYREQRGMLETIKMKQPWKSASAQTKTPPP